MMKDKNIETLADEGLALFLAHSKFWKNLYEKAPSAALKKYYRYDFGRSALMQCPEEEEQNVEEEVNALLSRAVAAMHEFSMNDWNYLIDNTHNIQQKLMYEKWRDEKFGSHK